MAQGMAHPLKIDGSILGGGGQILRIAISSSVITGKTVHVEKIRGGRKRGGLAPQHLKGVELARELCGATVEGAHMGSSAVLFRPGSVRGGHYAADTHTAGSVALLLQVAFPCCLFSDGVTELTLKGGTNAEMAPQIEYVANVFKPMASHFGAHLHLDVRRRGFFPAGNGEVLCRIEPVAQLKAATLTDRGSIEHIAGEAFVAGKIPPRLADEMAQSASGILRVHCSRPVSVKVVEIAKDEAVGSGWGINLYATTSTGCVLGASQLGRPGRTGEQVGRLAAEELVEAIESQSCVDQHLQDQLALLMALSCGRSSLRTGPLTVHTETAMHVLWHMTGAKFTVTKVTGGSCIIACQGIGLTNPYMK